MTSNADAIRQLFGAQLGEMDMGGANLPLYQGIYPDYEAPVLLAADQGAQLATMRWGWPPFGEVKRPITNVRNLASPMWRSALRDPARRCLVPTTAFCEYAAAPDPVTRRKRQHWFALASGEPFAFAGLWRPAEQGARFAFLTCEPNAMVGAVHPRAMPVMLSGAGLARWLQADWADAQHLVVPYPDGDMVEIPVTFPGDAPVSQPGLFG